MLARQGTKNQCHGSARIASCPPTKRVSRSKRRGIRSDPWRTDCAASCKTRCLAPDLLPEKAGVHIQNAWIALGLRLEQNELKPCFLWRPADRNRGRRREARAENDRVPSAPGWALQSSVPALGSLERPSTGRRIACLGDRKLAIDTPSRTRRGFIERRAKQWRRAPDMRAQKPPSRTTRPSSASSSWATAIPAASTGRHSRPSQFRSITQRSSSGDPSA
jgi:hypothetical protein